MTATATEDLTADEFYAADEPAEGDETAGQGTEPEAPYGWIRDPETGEMRPKKRAGRPKRPPTAEELAAAPPVERGKDQPPKTPRRRRTAPKDTDAPPMPEGGFIASGVNRLYRRAGRIIRALDHDIGTAVIECTRPDPDDPEALTVGQAWENLCKTNPRIRRFVLNALAGGAWSDLVWAHAPIGIALVMKPWVQRMIPFRRLVESMGEPDEDSGPGEGNLPGGMTAEDVGEMSGLAQDMARKAAARMGIQVTDLEMAEAVRMASGRGLTPPYVQHELGPDEVAGDGVPDAFRRAQPKRTTRAARTGKR